jgi:phosphoribosylglycinamide formyltransferase-1
MASTYTPIAAHEAEAEMNESERPVRVAVMGSTTGTGLRAIIDAIEGGSLKGIEVVLVLSNREDSGILQRARKHGLRGVFVSPEGLTCEAYDDQVSTLFASEGIELVLLIGSMKPVSAGFVDAWRNRVMNTRPSLLPAFAGGTDLNIHKEVIKRGCRVSGASLIFIDKGVDTGPIISQEVVPVCYSNDPAKYWEERDTPETLKAKVQAAEGRLLIQALEWWRDGRISVIGTTVTISSK